MNEDDRRHLSEAIERNRQKQKELRKMNAAALPGSLGSILGKMKGADDGNSSKAGRK